MEKIDKTILVVDHDPAILRRVQEALQSAGYQVIIKTDGRDALSLFDQGTVADLVIINHQLPGMNGLEFMAELRKKASSIPVVLLNAGGDIETYLKAVNLGAHEYVNKPLDLKDLSAIVKSLLTGGVKCRTYGGDIRCDDEGADPESGTE